MMMIDKKKIINNNKPGNLNPLTALKLEDSMDDEENFFCFFFYHLLGSA